MKKAKGALKFFVTKRKNAFLIFVVSGFLLLLLLFFVFCFVSLFENTKEHRKPKTFKFQIKKINRMLITFTTTTTRKNKNKITHTSFFIKTEIKI